MPILPPISAVGAATPSAITAPVARTSATDPAAEARGVDFGKAVVDALENLQSAHAATDAMAEKAATGDLQAVEDYMVMATETQLATQLTVAVRNRAVESFNEIMRMQI